MALLASAFYAVGIGIGVVLAATRGWDLLWLGVAGALIGFFYTAPPLRLVHRGLGEVAVAAGFGPIMALGAYFVQAREYALEPFLASIPVAILIALILYVNEVPDRPATRRREADAAVRWSKEAVINGYIGAVVVTFGLIVVFAVDGSDRPPDARSRSLAAPLALPVVRALRESYDQPYALMPAMGKNIQLHLVTGLLLVVGYVIAIVADAALDDPPFFLLSAVRLEPFARPEWSPLPFEGASASKARCSSARPASSSRSCASSPAGRSTSTLASTTPTWPASKARAGRASARSARR